jgi:urease accessory protein UreH
MDGMSEDDRMVDDKRNSRKIIVAGLVIGALLVCLLVAAAVLMSSGGSRFFQSTTIRLKKDSTLLYWDIIYPGRYARGEEFLYDIYCSGLDVFIENEPGLIDTVKIEPKKHDPRSPGILGKGRFAANVYAYAEDYGPFMKEIGETGCGVTAAGILLVRLVSDDWPSMKDKLVKIKSSFRRSYASYCR